MNVPFGGSRLFSVNTQTNKNDYNMELGRVFKENEICECVGMQTQGKKKKIDFFDFFFKGGRRLDSFLRRRLHGMERYWGKRCQAKCPVSVFSGMIKICLVKTTMMLSACA